MNAVWESAPVLAGGWMAAAWEPWRKALTVGSMIAERAVASFAGSFTTEDCGRARAGRARELHRLSRALLDVLGVRVEVTGEVPMGAGIVVSNHVSFADILVISAVRPVVFVAKSEVAAWPMVGRVARASGTLFIDRGRRADVVRVNDAVRLALEAGMLVVLFPEGTSSCGTSVLPFRSSLLQPAIECGFPVVPAWVGYQKADGARFDEVAYFGERSLPDCLWALMKERDAKAQLRFGVPRRLEGSRQKAAISLHAEVSGLGIWRG